MTVEPLASSEVDAFRERGDAFTRDLLQEYYEHYAGHKESLDIERVYEEYEDLTTLEAASPGTLRIRSGNIGLASRDSTATNTASSTSAALPKPIVCAEIQPY